MADPQEFSQKLQLLQFAQGILSLRDQHEAQQAVLAQNNETLKMTKETHDIERQKWDAEREFKALQLEQTNLALAEAKKQAEELSAAREIHGPAAMHIGQVVKAMALGDERAVGTAIDLMQPLLQSREFAASGQAGVEYINKLSAALIPEERRYLLGLPQVKAAAHAAAQKEQDANTLAYYREEQLTVRAQGTNALALSRLDQAGKIADQRVAALNANAIARNESFKERTASTDANAKARIAIERKKAETTVAAARMMKPSDMNGLQQLQDTMIQSRAAVNTLDGTMSSVKQVNEWAEGQATMVMKQFVPIQTQINALATMGSFRENSADWASMAQRLQSATGQDQGALFNKLQETFSVAVQQPNVTPEEKNSIVTTLKGLTKVADDVARVRHRQKAYNLLVSRNDAGVRDSMMVGFAAAVQAGEDPTKAAVLAGDKHIGEEVVPITDALKDKEILRDWSAYISIPMIPGSKQNPQSPFMVARAKLLATARNKNLPLRVMDMLLSTHPSNPVTATVPVPQSTKKVPSRAAFGVKKVEATVKAEEPAKKSDQELYIEAIKSGVINPITTTFEMFVRGTKGKRPIWQR